MSATQTDAESSKRPMTVKQIHESGPYAWYAGKHMADGYTYASPGATREEAIENLAAFLVETLERYKLALHNIAAMDLGLEVGRLSARLDAQPQEWNGTYHAENAHILERVANAKGYIATFERSADVAWVFGTFTPRPQRPRPTVVPKID